MSNSMDRIFNPLEFVSDEALSTLIKRKIRIDKAAKSKYPLSISLIKTSTSSFILKTYKKYKFTYVKNCKYSPIRNIGGKQKWNNSSPFVALSQ